MEVPAGMPLRQMVDAVLFVALSCMAACSGNDPSVPAVSELAIVHGEPSLADDAVVGVVAGSSVVCSGVFIGRRVVLTAAHCLPHGPTRVFFGSAQQHGGHYIDIVRAAPHPDYGSGLSERDVAALLLAEDPRQVVPLPLLATAIDATWKGTTVRLVGFGSTTSEPTLTARKRAGTAMIAAMNSSVFRHEASPAMACFGDSGGPALATRDGVEQVVGIASGGDERCESFGLHVRIDVIREFVDSFPVPTREPGERCSAGASCTTGMCVEPTSLGAFRYCSEHCSHDSDCPTGMTCLVDEAGERLCRHALPSLGGLAHTCELPDDCASGTCEASAAAGVQVCTLRCFSGNAVTCPEGFECKPSAGESEQEACFLRAPEVDAAGCRVTSPGGSERSPGPTAAFALLLVLKRTAPRWRRTNRKSLYR
jgi:hypothetical protein